MHETAYGAVSTDDCGTEVSATGLQLWDWSHRSGAVWPCSDLSRLDEISVEFDSRGDLVDITPQYEGTANEINAWSSDVLRAAGLNDHPAIRS